ncbi:MAG: twin-arginine translocase subunit TatA, partial [Moraxellaceae bacterium]
LLVIVLIFFGGSRLRNLGGDLGGAIKGFKKAMSDGDKEKEQEKLNADDHKIIDGVIQKDKVTSEKDQPK